MTGERPLTRTEAQDAVVDLGWRFLLGALRVAMPADGLADATQVAAAAVTAAGDDADEHLRMDVRPDRVEFSLATRSSGRLTARDIVVARAISLAVGRVPLPATDVDRPVQELEIAIDTLDASRIRPFWKAVLAYVDDPADAGAPDGALVDPQGLMPAVWFQSMDLARPQRNRIHLDVTVAHDEAETRVAAALAAGGRLLDDSHARSFWVLADADGNEVCVCTWLDRDVEDGPAA